MATLEDLRQDVLNVELGLDTDPDTGNDARFGTKAQRNLAIAQAIAKLWPRCALLTAEAVSLATGDTTYTLSTVVDVVAIELTDTTLAVARPTRDYKHWRSYREETPASIATHLEFLSPINASTYTVRVIGYRPYAVPTVDASVLDTPAIMDHVISAGARAILYMRRLNQFVDFARLTNTDRTTQLGPAEFLAMWRAADEEYNRGISDFQRGWSESRIATFSRG